MGNEHLINIHFIQMHFKQMFGHETISASV